MKKIFILAAAAFALTACDQNDDNPALSSAPVQIFASIGESAPSRAVDNEWAEGDKIGITLVTAGDRVMHCNMEYTTDAKSNAFTGNDMYFYRPMILTAYYPFAGSEGTAPEVFEVTTGADMQTAEMQATYDFLWDQQSDYEVVDARPQVNFSFEHKMSKVTLTLNAGNDVTDLSKVVAYQIEGLVLDGTFDPATGVAKIKDESESAVLKMDMADGVTSGTALTPLILFPQTPEGNVTLRIFSNELDNEELLQQYSCTLSFGNGSLEPGKNYIYTITVSKTGLKVNAGITNWDDEDMESNASSSD